MKEIDKDLSIYSVKIPNYEIEREFYRIINTWFSKNINGLVLKNILQDLINLNFESYNENFKMYCLEMFSYFDVNEKNAERFYHAFVLGMLVYLKDSYYIRSNGMSGYGRYDIMLEPIDKKMNAYIMEFKVYNKVKEKSIKETIENAKKQIENKKYDADLKARGFNNIYKQVYAFKGKDVVVESYK